MSGDPLQSAPASGLSQTHRHLSFETEELRKKQNARVWSVYTEPGTQVNTASLPLRRGSVIHRGVCSAGQARNLGKLGVPLGALT